jgi:hypothetical protein
MAQSEARPRVAVCSYMPGHAYTDAGWPASGPVTWDELAARLPKDHHVKVLEIPVCLPAHLHFQRGAQWVVLELAAPECEVRDGRVAFRHAVVVFHGPAQEARAYLESRGLPGPSSFAPPEVVADWASGSVGQSGLILGGNSRVRAGDRGLAHATAGAARAGRYGIAVSTGFAAVEAGDHGVAVTTHGTSAVAGDLGLARCDEFGVARAGRLGVAVADEGGQASVGDLGVAVGMHGGNAAAGTEGIALALESMAGFTGIARARERGIALATGSEGAVSAGPGGVLLVVRDGRGHVAHVGEGGIQPYVADRVDDDGRWVPADTPPGG